MASDKLLDFTWGDTVKVIFSAPKHYKPGLRGSICGIRTIDTIEISKQFDQIIGSELYLVEFSNGETLEIPKSFLTLT